MVANQSLAESLIILEYIEETWPEVSLLPKDAHERALARFWIQFLVDKRQVFQAFFHAANEDEREKASKETMEVLKILEEQALGDKKCFGGETVNMVDLAYGLLSTHWSACMEVVVGVRLIELNTLPGLHAWVQNFKQVPVIKDNLPDYERLLAYYKQLRQKVLYASTK